MKIFLAAFFLTLNSIAAVNGDKKTTTKEVTASTSTSTSTSSNGRSHNFEDLLVNGKYHFADEAVSTVEADKVFDSLIGVRNDFKDRLEDSTSNK